MEIENGKLLCLDIGRKKIGVAISENNQLIARGVATWNFKIIYDELNRFLLKNEIVAIILGLPLSMSGEERDSASEVKEIAKTIEEKFKLPIYFQDERLSSWDARERLREMGYRKIRIKELEDQMAAQIILQEFLNKLE